MRRYVARRLLLTVPFLFAVSAMLFVILTLAPGDPVDLFILSNREIEPKDVEILKKAYGLDRPIPVRYIRWLGRVLSGDLGWSLYYRQPVATILSDRLPNSLLLTLPALAIAVGLAVPIGVLSAVRQHSLADHLANAVAFAGFSIPLFWLGIVAMYVFAVVLRWLPPGGFPGAGTGTTEVTLLAKLRYMILPMLVISFHLLALLVRHVRSSVLEVIRQDFVRTAHAKGLSALRVMSRHVLRNAMLPVVTILSLTTPALFGGAPVTESVFGWPGIGHLLVQSVLVGDHLVSMAVLMMIALLVVAFSLAADIAYSSLDPRIQYE
ncbi:MAG: ABC transporter permease [Armatimonadota bacterium]